MAGWWSVFVTFHPDGYISADIVDNELCVFTNGVYKEKKCVNYTQLSKTYCSLQNSKMPMMFK